LRTFFFINRPIGKFFQQRQRELTVILHFVASKNNEENVGAALPHTTVRARGAPVCLQGNGRRHIRADVSIRENLQKGVET